MGRYTVPLGLLVAAVFAQALAGSIDVPQDGQKFEPMVAFICNKPAMRRTPEGWARDDKTDCIQDSVEILNYCKKMYPNHDITNVVEANYVVTIDDWCSVGHTHCHSHGSHSVRPFRCLVGAFQSTALLVPEHCRFDHYHDRKLCETYDWWNRTSGERCNNDDLTCQSFDILLPCGVDRFSGVEFVCCPKNIEHKPKIAIDVHIEHPEEPAPEQEDEDDKPETDEDSSEEEDSQEEVLPPPTPETEGPYTKYLKNQDIEGADSEHERFIAAKKDWQKRHHEKITKMMKQWSSARQRIADLKDSDPKTAEKLNKEITERFQRMYHALEQEGNAEKQQLVTLHQQHVQKVLNEKKRVAMQEYMNELQLDEPQTSRVLESLQRYIKVEEKDRRHTLNHYQHVRDTNPMEAERIREVTLDHLDWIDKRINQSVKMLSRLPEIEEKVRPEIKKYLLTYQGINSDVAKSVLRPITKEEAQESTKFDADKIPKTQEEFETKVEESRPAVEVKVEEVKPAVQTYIEKEPEQENTHQYFDVKPHFAAHKLEDKAQAQNSYRHVSVQESSYGASFGIAMGSVAVFVIIVVAVVMLRKRSQRQSVTHGFVEVDPAASPEERHVANMQMNGYENPTYRYFELGTSH